MTLLKQSAAALLAPLTGMSEGDLALELEYPPEDILGDLSLPCFPLAKELRRAPHLIAAELAARVNELGASAAHAQSNTSIVWSAEPVGGFLNLTVQGTGWMDALLREAESPQLGQLPDGAGRKVIIDYSAPNIAKPFSIGHLRSTVIGRALANLYRAAGWQTETVNHLGDWGTQFGKLIAAYKNWGSREALEGDPIPESLQLYVRFHEEAQTRPELNDEGRGWFRKLEQGDARGQRTLELLCP